MQQLLGILRRLTRVLPSLSLKPILVFLLLLHSTSYATNYIVDRSTDDTSGNGGSGTTGDLRYVITQLNDTNGGNPNRGSTGAGANNNTITFNSSLAQVTLGADLPVINQKGVSITTASGTQAISGASNYRIFATFQASLSLSNLAISNGKANGGNGGSFAGGGGGGGLGAGGGAYVDYGQTLSLSNTTFANCEAKGGAGGNFVSATGGSGGGGASFSVGTRNSSSQVGGGDRGGNTKDGGATITGPSSGYGGGAGATGAFGNGGAGGGSGAGSGNNLTTNGGNGGYCGGGGAGCQANAWGSAASGGGNGGGTSNNGATEGGGGGGYGSGGGGGGDNGLTGGGGGGFGGGGGGAGRGANSSLSGGGGWGGGSGGLPGSGLTSLGVAGRFGGTGGTNAGGGGGGAGIGGAIFVGDGATLDVGDGFTGPSLVNIINGGAAGSGGSVAPTAGTGFAEDIFLFRKAKITFTGAADLTVNYAIDGDSAAPTNADPTSQSDHRDLGIVVNKSGGTGTVTLSPTIHANSFRGPTTLTAGSLSISADNNLGSAPGSATANWLNFGGGTLVTTASFTLNANRGIVLNATGIIQPASSTTLTYNGIIAGTNALSKTGAGTLVLGGINTFSGAVNVNAGVLSVAADNNLGNAANSLAFAGGALATSASFSTSRNSSLGSGGGTFQPAAATTFTYNGVISGSNPLTMSGAGTLVLGGVNTFTGALNLAAGTLSVAADNNFGNAANSLSFAGGALTTTSSFSSSRNASLGTGGGTIQPAAATTFTYNGVISGSNAFTKAGAGILLLGAANTYTGGTSVTAGILRAGIANALASSTSLNLSNVAGVSFDLNNFNQTIGSLSGGGGTGGNISLGSGALSINQTALGTYAGVISGTGGIRLSSSSTNTLVLSGVNTFTGGVNLDAGILSVAADNNLGNAANSLAFAGGALATSASFSSSRTASLGTGGGTFRPATGTTFTFNGIISGANALTKSDAGILIFGAANTYSGATSITAGTLRAGIANALASTSALSLSNIAGAVFDLNNFNQTIGSLSGGGATGGNISLGSAILSVNQTAAGTYAGVISGTGGLTMSSSSTNTLTLTGANTYTGATTISAGTLALTAASNASAITTATNGTLKINSGVTTSTANIINNGNLQIAGTLSMPTRSLTGSGTVTVSGQQTLTAATYTNTGTHTTTITDQSTYDKLTCTGCAVNLSNINITINTASLSGSTISFPIITASSITANLPTIAGDLFTSINVANSGTQITVDVTKKSFTSVATGGENQAIAAIIDSMSSGTPNAQQQALIDALSSSANANVFNASLENLEPNANTATPSFTTQNQALNKVELRIAALRDGYVSPTVGFNAGDLNPRRSVWMSTFGSITSQGPVKDNVGYNSKTAGLLLGIDSVFRDYVFGFAAGISDSHVKQLFANDRALDIDRYHGLLYGTRNLAKCNFLDWLVSGSINHNQGLRPAMVGNTQFNSNSKFDSYNAAVKLIRGRSFDFLDSYRIVPFTLLQYNYLHQNAYSETGSPAALNVAEQVKSIVTLGLGTRFNFPIDAWDTIGMRELRVVATYDVLNKKDVTVANFVAGSADFQTVSTPGRWGVKFGAGMTFEISKHVDFQLNYDYEIRQRFTDHTGMLKVKYVL